MAGAEPSGRMRDQELHACGAESKSLASGGPLVKTNVSVTFRIGPLAPVVVAGQAATSCIGGCNDNGEAIFWQDPSELCGVCVCVFVLGLVAAEYQGNPVNHIGAT